MPTNYFKALSEVLTLPTSASASDLEASIASHRGKKIGEIGTKVAFPRRFLILIFKSKVASYLQYVAT